MSLNRQSAGGPRRRLTAEQEPFLVARALSTTYSSGSCIHPHRHASHQLLFASSGAMTVTGDRTSWMIPPGRAVLIPAGIPHAIRMWGEVAMRSLYFPVRVPAPVFGAGTCRVISVQSAAARVDPAGRRDGRARLTGGAEARLMSVLDGRARVGADRAAVAAAAVRCARAPAADTDLEESGGWRDRGCAGRRCGLSTRTLERLFRAETGMRFGLWRQKARLLESVRVLAEGGSVTDAALESGYASVSAYIAAFKQTFGCTPGAMLAERG